MYQRLGDEMIELGSKLEWQALAACIKFEQSITVSATQPFKRLALYRLIMQVLFRGPKCCA